MSMKLVGEQILLRIYLQSADPRAMMSRRTSGSSKAARKEKLAGATVIRGISNTY